MDFATRKKEIYNNYRTNRKEIIMFGEYELHLDDDIDEFFLQKAQEELRETPEIITKGYEELQALIAEAADIPIHDEEILKMFLRPCKWYAKSAFSLIKRFLRYRQTYSHIFLDLVPSKQKIGLCSDLVFPLPLRGQDGCRILIIEGGKKWKPKETPLEDCWKGLLFLLFSAMMESKTQIAGARVIIDVEALSLSQITYITPSFARMVVEFLNKALPLRLKSIHIVNQSFIFNVAFAIFKPFLGEKIRKRIHFHGTNWESLIAFVGKKALLKRHGGEIEMPDDGFGVKLWQDFLLFEPIFTIFDEQPESNAEQESKTEQNIEK